MKPTNIMLAETGTSGYLLSIAVTGFHGKVTVTIWGINDPYYIGFKELAIHSDGELDRGAWRPGLSERTLESIFEEWLKSVRSMVDIREWWKILRAKLRGHYQYYGISENFMSILKGIKGLNIIFQSCLWHIPYQMRYYLWEDGRQGYIKNIKKVILFGPDKL